MSFKYKPRMQETEKERVARVNMSPEDTLTQGRAEFMTARGKWPTRATVSNAFFDRMLIGHLLRYPMEDDVRMFGMDIEEAAGQTEPVIFHA